MEPQAAIANTVPAACLGAMRMAVQCISASLRCRGCQNEVHWCRDEPAKTVKRLSGQASVHGGHGQCMGAWYVAPEVPWHAGTGAMQAPLMMACIVSPCPGPGIATITITPSTTLIHRTIGGEGRTYQLMCLTRNGAQGPVP